jgi:hypothetical protein
MMVRRNNGKGSALFFAIEGNGLGGIFKSIFDMTQPNNIIGFSLG